MIQPPRPSSTATVVRGDSGLFANCPECNGRDFLIDDTGPVAFTCLVCGSHWHYNLGYVCRLNIDQPELSSQS